MPGARDETAHNLRNNYIYEFGTEQSPSKEWLLDAKVPKELTRKEVSQGLLKYFGDLVPAVRCQNHGGVYLNLDYSGKVYLSPVDWATAPESAMAVRSSLQRIIVENRDTWLSGMDRYSSSAAMVSCHWV